MITILFLWTTVAANNYGSKEGWRSLAEFNNPAACQEAVRLLGVKKDEARCIPKG